MSLQDITLMAREVVDLDKQIEATETTLKALAKKRSVIAENTLPDAMFTLGLTELKLATGQVVTIKDTLRASIRSLANIQKVKTAEERTALMEKRGKALAWLKENGLGDLIKLDVEVHLGKGQEALAQQAVGALEAIGVEPAVVEEVNSATLSAALRELASQGVDLDYEVLNATLMREAVIK